MRFVLSIALLLVMVIGAFAQAVQLMSPEDKLDAKDVQIFDAKMHDLETQAALLQTQLELLKAKYAQLAQERKTKSDAVMERNHLDASKVSIDWQTGQISPKEAK